MLQKSILGEIKKKITPSIYTIGKEYYDKRLGNLTALFADGNVMTVEGDFFDICSRESGIFGS